MTRFQAAGFKDKARLGSGLGHARRCGWWCYSGREVYMARQGGKGRSWTAWLRAGPCACVRDKAHGGVVRE